MHITSLPALGASFRAHEDILEPMFTVVRTWRLVAFQKASRLALEYVERRALWEQFSAALNDYAHESRTLIDSWPPEFVRTPKIGEPMDSDEPMYLDAMEAENYCFYDMNRFVPDPVKAHNEYRTRLAWTQSEVKTFVERYAQHPKEFKRIAAALPGKSVKDVIEFYSIHRIDLNLKDVDVSARKRGRKKVLISEGRMRK
jgi:hypothetical protein